MRLARLLALLLALSVPMSDAFGEDVAVPAAITSGRSLRAPEVAAALMTALLGTPGVRGLLVAGEGEVKVTLTSGRSLSYSARSFTDGLNMARDGGERRRLFLSQVAALRQKIAEMQSETAPSAEEFRRSLIVVVRSRAYFAALKAQAREGGPRLPTPVVRPVVADVIAHIAVDTPAMTRLYDAGEGARYGLSDDEAFAAGLENLRRLTERVTHEQHGPVALLTFDADYNAALLLTEVWSALPSELGDDLVVAVPARDLIAYGSARDPEALAALRRVAALPDRGYPVTRKLLRRAGAKWVEFE